MWFVRTLSRASPLPQWDLLHVLGMGWLVGRYRWQASPHGLSTSDRDSAGRHRQQAGSYSGIRCVQQEIGRLSGRLREQALLLQKQNQKIAACGSSYMDSRRSRPIQQDERKLGCRF